MHFLYRSIPLADSPPISYFAAYEVTKKMLTPEGQSPSELNLGAIIVAGGTAGIAMWSIAIPPDVSPLDKFCNFHSIQCPLHRSSSQEYSQHPQARTPVSWTAHAKPLQQMVLLRSGKVWGPPWRE